MRLALRSWNLAGLRQSFEVPQILNDCLFRVAANDAFAQTGKFAHAELLKDRDHRSASTRRWFEDDLPRIVRLASHRTPGDAAARLIGQNLGIPLNAVAVISRSHHPVRNGFSGAGHTYDLLLPQRDLFNIAPHLIKIAGIRMNQSARSDPYFAMFVLGGRRVMSIDDDANSPNGWHRLGIWFFQCFRHCSSS